MEINELFSPDLLQEMLTKGYVSTQTHPTDSLTIYNYSPSAQYEGLWNEVTSQCRGLIVDHDTGEVIARPFKKFFNYAEYVEKGQSFPFGDPIVTEKYDGSLGIIYTYKGETSVATRGSFMSEQAQWAAEYLRDRYPEFEQPEGVTTLVEIIYPQNRIVVDYGTRQDLVLLGAILNSTGEDITNNKIDWWSGPRTETYKFRSIDDTLEKVTGPSWTGVDSWADGEGVVLCWPLPGRPSVRVKVKHPRYVSLHRIVTNLSTRSVHEALANNSLGELLEVVPDEFHAWLHAVEETLLKQFSDIEQCAISELAHAQYEAGPFYDRRELAEQVKKTTYPGLCFALEDGKDIAPRIWQMIRPEREMAAII